MPISARDGLFCKKKTGGVLIFFTNMTYIEEHPQGNEPSEDVKEAFFEGLRQADAPTIRALAVKVLPDIRLVAGRAGLRDEDAEEILNDAILVTLSAIRKGTFRFMGFHPATYTLGVAKKLVANRARSPKAHTELQENMAPAVDFTPESYLENKERVSIVKELLNRLGKECRKVLLLKYFEHRRDQEVVSEKLTPYSTIGSLKSKRGECLKKLAEAARKAGIQAPF